MRGLLDRRLVRIAGRAEEVGRPILYGTTRDFLQVFGLAGIDDLPEVEGLQRGGSRSKRKAAPVADSAEDAVSSEDSDADPRENEVATT